MMAGDLKLQRFLVESHDNVKRYVSNLQSIISKYDKSFSDDEDIDLTSLSIVKEKGLLRKQKPRHIGSTRLLSTKRREQSILSDCQSELSINETLKNQRCTPQKNQLMNSSGNSINSSEDYEEWKNKSLWQNERKDIWGRTVIISPKEDFHCTYTRDADEQLDDDDEIDNTFLSLKDNCKSVLGVLDSDTEEPSDGETLSSLSSSDSDWEDVGEGLEEREECSTGLEEEEDICTTLSSCSEDEIQIVEEPTVEKSPISKGFRHKIANGNSVPDKWQNITSQDRKHGSVPVKWKDITSKDRKHESFKQDKWKDTTDQDRKPGSAVPDNFRDVKSQDRKLESYVSDKWKDITNKERNHGGYVPEKWKDERHQDRKFGSADTRLDHRHEGLKSEYQNKIDRFATNTDVDLDHKFTRFQPEHQKIDRWTTTSDRTYTMPTFNRNFKTEKWTSGKEHYLSHAKSWQCNGQDRAKTDGYQTYLKPEMTKTDPVYSERKFLHESTDLWCSSDQRKSVREMDRNPTIQHSDELIGHDYSSTCNYKSWTSPNPKIHESDRHNHGRYSVNSKSEKCLSVREGKYNGRIGKRYKPVLPEVSTEQLLAYLKGNDPGINALYSPEIMKNHHRKISESEKSTDNVKFCQERVDTGDFHNFEKQLSRENHSRAELTKANEDLPNSNLHNLTFVKNFSGRKNRELSRSFHQDSYVQNREKVDDKRKNRDHRVCDTSVENERQSPFRKSARDLSDIETLAKSDFHSPEIQKSKNGNDIFRNTSKSVPAKCLFSNSNKTSVLNTFMKMQEKPMSSEDKVYKWIAPSPNSEDLLSDRYTLKARRRLTLMTRSPILKGRTTTPGKENIHHDTSRDSNNNANMKTVVSSPKFDPYNFSTNGDSPSTHFSRLKLRSSPLTSKASSCVSTDGKNHRYLSHGTNNQVSDGKIVIKPINAEAVFEKPVGTSLFKSPSLTTKSQKKDTGYSIKAPCNGNDSRFHSGTNVPVDSEARTSDSRKSLFTKFVCISSPPPVPKRFDDISQKSNSDMDSAKHYSEVGKKKHHSTNNRVSTTNQKFRMRQNHEKFDGEYTSTKNKFSNKNPSSTYAQSTPLKANIRFNLNDTFSTICAGDQDDTSSSDDDIITISPSDEA